MKLTGGILGWGGERLGGVHGSLVGYVKECRNRMDATQAKPAKNTGQLRKCCLDFLRGRQALFILEDTPISDSS